MAFRSFSASWSRFFGLSSDPQPRPAPPPERPQSPPRRAFSREALEVAWLLCCLPSSVQTALAPELLRLKRTCPFTGRLPVEGYTWPGVPGVRRPRYDRGILSKKSLEGLCSRLHEDLKLGVTALCAPESALPRLMRNALLAVQGQRLGQLCELLAQRLPPEEVLLLFRQELAARREPPQAEHCL